MAVEVDSPLSLTWTSRISWSRVSLRLGGNLAEDGEWLHSFYSPWGRFGPGEADSKVVLRRDDALYEGLQERLNSCSESTSACFTLDRKVVRLPVLSLGETICCFDRELEACYLVERQAARVQVVARVDELKVRLGAARVIREMLWQAQRQTVIAVHASCLARGGRAYLVLGPKSAGKTTLLSYLMLRDGVRLISNDLTFLVPTQSGWEAHGMPTVVRVRPGTGSLLTELSPRLAYSRSFLLLDSESVDAYRPVAEPGPPGMAYFSPAEFARRLSPGGAGPQAESSGAAGGAPLGGLLLPNQSKGPGSVKRSSHQSSSILANSLYGPDGRRPAHTVFGEGLERPPGLPAIPSVPCWEVCLSPQDFADGQAAEKIFRELDSVRQP